MTTDPFPKEAAVEIVSPKGTFRVGGIAKGSGMIEPMMATMLGFVTTDAAVAPGAAAARASRRPSTTRSTRSPSTASARPTTACSRWPTARAASRSSEPISRCWSRRCEAVCEPLAIGIVRGGEGATKLITVNVSGARSDADAKRAARAIANSPLVKTAIHGGDPNWGRLVAVAGRSGAAFVARSRARADRPVELFSDGVPHDERAPEAAEYLQGRDIEVGVDLGTGGTAQARMWTCDLSAEYVRINAEYRT